jgi:hypothetical protein
MFYAESEDILQIYMLNAGVLEHIKIAVPPNPDCNMITQGGWGTSASIETGLWPGKLGFNYQYKQRLSLLHHSTPAVQTSKPLIQGVLGGYFPGRKAAGA